MVNIVITGGIGSGKTAVTDYLATKGFPIIDTDEMSHQMTAPGGKAIPYIREHFGEKYILADGSLNRKAMRDLVYQNPEQMEILEEGTTRVIQEDLRRMLLELSEQGKPVVFLAIPLFFETEENPSNYDGVWTVTARPEVRMSRVRKRDGLTDSMIQQIMDKQASEEVRRRGSTEIIDNSGSLEELHRRVDGLLQKYGLNH